jgi:hypothetical protein
VIEMTSTILAVYNGAMIRHRGESSMLEIRAGNFASEIYSNEKGAETRGATAGVWLVLRGHPETNVYHRVHAGQTIDYPGFQIKAATIGSDQRGTFVRLEVEDAGHGAGRSGEKRNS